jgi:hypothetical protein
MEKEQHLNDPWLVATWPGMGAVAISGGYYLMAKLGMHLLARFPAREFFDLERVEVKDGLIQTGRGPATDQGWGVLLETHRPRGAAWREAGVHLRRDGHPDAPGA